MVLNLTALMVSEKKGNKQMNKETFGIVLMFIMFAGSLAISLTIQEFDSLLGYTIGVFGVLFSIGVGLNIMTWDKK